MAQELKRVTNLAWRRFLTSEAGVEGMLYLREKAPSVLKGDADGIIFDAGRAQGWRACLDEIAEIVSTPKEDPQSLENP